MKKYIITILFILLVCQPVFGSTYASKLDRVTDFDMKVAVLRAGLTVGDFGGTGQFTSGRIYYVDSATGDSASNGESWLTAMATLDQAINRAAARVANGTDLGKPVIYVREGHNEALAAAGFDADLAGLTVWGLGNGSHTPTFDYDVGTGTGIIGAANVTLYNLRLRTSVTGVVSGIVVEAAGDNARIIKCDFGFAEAVGTDEFLCAIDVAGDDILIEGCRFNAQAAGAVSAIQIQAVSGATLRNNHIQGDYSSAGIFNTGVVATDLIIGPDNVVFNGSMDGDGEINTVAAMSLSNDCAGYVYNNHFVSAAATGGIGIRVGDDVTFANNITSFTDGDEFSGGLESGATSITLSQSANGF